MSSEDVIMMFTVLHTCIVIINKQHCTEIHSRLKSTRQEKHIHIWSLNKPEKLYYFSETLGPLHYDWNTLVAAQYFLFIQNLKQILYCFPIYRTLMLRKGFEKHCVDISSESNLDKLLNACERYCLSKA